MLILEIQTDAHKQCTFEDATEGGLSYADQEPRHDVGEG